jgi:hypothetical protein
MSILRWLNEWQARITEIISSLAVLTALVTVGVTIWNANRQIEASKVLERRRLAKESLRFHGMLVAGMESIVEDIGAART